MVEKAAGKDGMVSLALIECHVLACEFGRDQR